MKYLVAIFLCFLLFGCGTKRQYFNPKHIEAELKSNGNLNSGIDDWTLYAANLQNNKVITKDSGLNEKFKLPKSYILLAYSDNEFFTADLNGNLKIFNNDNEETFNYKFDAAVVSVSANGDDLALVLADNTIVLANRSLGIKYSQTLTPAPAQDSRAAAPIFLDNTIIYPSLDGKILILSKDNYENLKDIIISAEPFFNNVIYLHLLMNDRIIAGVTKKVMVITPKEQFSLNADVKDIVSNENNIFILTKDGEIIKTDLNLKVLNKTKFDFAIFTKATIYNQNLYVFEKTGYLIKLDLNLNQSQVFKLSSAIDKLTFMGDGKFYYSNKILNLQ